MGDQLLSVPDIARLIGCHQSTLYTDLARPGAPGCAKVVEGKRVFSYAEVARWWPERELRRPGRQPYPRTPTVDWSPLFGLEVTVTRPGKPPVRGVLLGDPMRIAVTHRPDRPAKAGEVEPVNPTSATVDPMPHQADAHPRDPGDLPLYVDTVPHLALATREQLLDQHHRVPSRRTHAVALALVGEDVVELYAIGDCRRIPRLSATATAAWKRARTCARCHKLQFEPLPKNHFESLYCPERCLAQETLARWTAARDRDRAAATTWARQVLEAGRAIWIDSTWGTVTPLLIGTLHNAGCVLENRPAVSILLDSTSAPRGSSQPDNVVDLSDLAPTLAQLAGRRIIAWDRDSAAILDNHRFKALVGDDLQLVDDDIFEQWLTRWIGLPYRQQHTDVYTPSGLMLVAPPDGARARFDQVLALLHEMAAGPPSEKRLELARAHQAPSRVLSLTWAQAYAAPAAHDPSAA